jgi:hypothetical protein
MHVAHRKIELAASLFVVAPHRPDLGLGFRLLTDLSPSFLTDLAFSYRAGAAASRRLGPGDRGELVCMGVTGHSEL